MNFLLNKFDIKIFSFEHDNGDLMEKEDTT